MQVRDEPFRGARGQQIRVAVSTRALRTPARRTVAGLPGIIATLDSVLPIDTMNVVGIGDSTVITSRSIGHAHRTMMSARPSPATQMPLSVGRLDHFGSVGVAVQEIQQDVAYQIRVRTRVEHDRQVVRHRQLDRQPPRGPRSVV